jgi:hypothetical protein
MELCWRCCRPHHGYAMLDHASAKRALDALLHELMHRNPSGARSLEEGMEETLTVHRLRIPEKLRRTLASTNLIESAFSTVETVCRNVKRWQGGDQYLRWVASGLLWAESRRNHPGLSRAPHPRQGTRTRRSQGYSCSSCQCGLQAGPTTASMANLQECSPHLHRLDGLPASLAAAEAACGVSGYTSNRPFP